MIEPDLDVPFLFGPNPIGSTETFGLTSEVGLSNWVLHDGIGRRTMQGGAVAPMDRLLIAADALQTGWYTLQLSGADGRRWSLSLVRR